MSEIIPQIDHVVVTVSNQLDAAKEQYEKLGFTLTKRGHHSLGTSNNLTIFGTTYLELLGYEPQNADKVDSGWRFDNGLTGLVFKTKDADSLYQSLVQHGVKVDGTGPKAFFRPVELDDGTQPEARFRTVRLDPSYTPNGQIFFCDQLTPQLVWRPEWQNHANGVTNIIRVVIEAADPAKSIDLLKRTFPTAKITTIEGGLRLNADGKSVDYITPSESHRQFGNALAKANNQQDRKIALTFATTSLTLIKSVLQHNSIPFIEHSHRIIVPASETFGVVMEFTQTP